MRLRFTLFSLTALIYLAGALASFAGNRSVALLYTQADQYDANAWARGEDRFPKGASIFRHDASGSRMLLPNFAATADPNISFDGSSVIFAGKKLSSDPWQIWEIGLAPGSQLRRVVSSTDDLVRPMYLPGDRAVYARKSNGRFTIESSSLDGTSQQRLFPLAVNALPTDVLLDGRILFMSGYPLGEGSTPELYTIYSDGSGVESYRCNHSGPHQFGKQISSGDIVFTSWKRLGRFTSALAVETGVQLPAGDYAGEVAEISSDEWLIPWRASGRNFVEIRVKKPRAAALTKFLSTMGKHVLQPVVVAPRPTPKKHPSALHDWRTANLLTLNVYTSKDQPIPAHVNSVRVYSKSDAGEVAVLGTAPVEKDGSFYVAVPGDRALQFELLDANGQTIRKQKGWFWSSKGEQRVCVGCHAGPERSPDNEVPAVLLRSTTPTSMADPATADSSGGH